MRIRGWGIAAVLWLCACTITTVQRDHNEQVAIPAGSGRISGDLGLGLGDIGADEVAEGDVQGISVSTFSITTVTPGTDIAFLERVDVYVEAAGLPRVLVASGSDFPPGARTVDLVPTDEEISDYLLGENLQVFTLVNGTMPDERTDLDVHVVVDIGVTPKGACNALQGGDAADDPAADDDVGSVHTTGSVRG